MWVNKGIMWAVYEEERAVVINTHMQAKDDALGWLLKEGGEGLEETYEKQMRQLRRCIDRLQGPLVDSVYVMGDLNSTWTPELEAATGMTKLSCNTATHVDGCIDHVLCRHSNPATTVESRRRVSCEVTETASDHKMIKVTL
eukprot:gnl/TRDRNA2_/TRDRNA2_140043_c1_seq2.p1 gnl/TRDRNA2_/TRDRNA2_140043_c1~~gnl/TRDRNA2_/TRDRNA2_140043_c1_seq2.p1  ORF type:complete len:164 (+),score=39.30 gnl/TRDRNA2_/TRDRNA2_140043_c1_seq2:68-493(+)